MGFNNQIVGGISKLVRAAIQSPNYVAGLLGWSINKDGTAEFSNISIRGRLALALLSSAADHTSDVYWQDGLTTPGRLVEVGQDTGAQTSKTLVLGGGSIDNVVGIVGGRDASIILDSFTPNDPTNPRTGTLWLMGYSDTQVDTKQVDGIIWIAPQAGGAKSVFIGRQGTTVAGAQSVVGIDGDIRMGRVGGSGSGISQYTVQTGVSGPKGKYYFEEFAIGAVPVPSGAGSITALASVANPLTITKSRNDYTPASSQMNLTTAVWTCPASGPYSVAVQAPYAGGLAGSRAAIYALRNANGAADPDLVQDIQDGSGRMRFSASTTREYTVGDTLAFGVLQVTGAAQTIHPGPGTYISIRRYL